MNPTDVLSGILRGAAIAAFHLICGLVLLTLAHLPAPLLTAIPLGFTAIGSAFIWELVLGAPGFLVYFAFHGAVITLSASDSSRYTPSVIAGISTAALLLLMSWLCGQFDINLLTSGFLPAFIFGGPVPVTLTAVFAAACWYWRWPLWEGP